MRDINFFSEDKYLYLPSIKAPKVILAVSDAKTSCNAHKLYNPFSLKAKFLKKVSRFLFVNCNSPMLSLIKVKSHQKSDFVNYIETKLNAKFTISIYYATVKDKVVLQLQTNNKVYGYLKFPLNEAGIANIQIEKKAIKLLSENRIISPYILADSYKGFPYIILPELKGEIGNLEDNAIKSLVSKFKKEKTFTLIAHQRIKGLYHDVKALQLESYRLKLDTILKKSTAYYYEAFEHGDFAPWNIVKTREGLIPFDFEFFIENGIEYFDLIKYYFQVGRLLEKKNTKELSLYIYEKVNIPEIEVLLSLFLIKEIFRLKKGNECYQFQDNLLNYICE